MTWVTPLTARSPLARSFRLEGGARQGGASDRIWTDRPLAADLVAEEEEGAEMATEVTGGEVEGAEAVVRGAEEEGEEAGEVLQAEAVQEGFAGLLGRSVQAKESPSSSKNAPAREILGVYCIGCSSVYQIGSVQSSLRHRPHVWCLMLHMPVFTKHLLPAVPAGHFDQTS